MPDEGADPLHIHAPYGSLGHPDHLQHIYGHLFPDRKDELVAKLNSRYGRALERQGRTGNREWRLWVGFTTGAFRSDQGPTLP